MVSSELDGLAPGDEEVMDSRQFGGRGGIGGVGGGGGWGSGLLEDGDGEVGMRDAREGLLAPEASEDETTMTFGVKEPLGATVPNPKP